MSSLAIIPARGGSKRLPGKNIRPFLGKPVLAYVIEAARTAGCFAEIMVSTDCPDTAAVAREHGASVPFLRRAETADDHSTVTMVIREVLQAYAAEGRRFEQAACLYATAALIRPERICQAHAMLEQAAEVEGVITLIPTAQPVSRALVVREEGVVFQQAAQHAGRSQDTEETYFDAAQMYWLRTAPFLASESASMAFLRRLPLVLSEFETQDINTAADWRLAELKYLFLQEHYEFLTQP